MWTLTANLSNIKLKKKCLLPYTVGGKKNMACTTGNICFKFEIVKSPVLMTALYRNLVFLRVWVLMVQQDVRFVTIQRIIKTRVL